MKFLVTAPRLKLDAPPPGIDRFHAWIATHNSKNKKTTTLVDQTGKEATYTVSPDGPYCYIGMHRANEDTLMYEMIGDPGELPRELEAQFKDLVFIWSPGDARSS